MAAKEYEKALEISSVEELPSIFSGLLSESTWTETGEGKNIIKRFTLSTGSGSAQSELTIAYADSFGPPSHCNVFDLLAIDKWNLADVTTIKCKTRLTEECIRDGLKGKEGLSGKMTTTGNNPKVISTYSNPETNEYGCGYRKADGSWEKKNGKDIVF